MSVDQVAGTSLGAKPDNRASDLSGGERPPASHLCSMASKALGVNWRPQVRVDSMALIREMVASGQGVGLDVEPTETMFHPQVRPIPLKISIRFR